MSSPSPATSIRQRLEAVSSLGRPLDPDWPTNRAVLLLMPVSAVVWAARAALAEGEWAGGGWAGAAVRGAAVVLGCWALGRELDPDRPGAAFLALALGVGVLWVEPSASLLLVFTVLGIVRVVNRTVGPPATGVDLASVLGLTGWCTWDTGNPGVAVGSALALGVDAILDPGRRGAWIAFGLAVALSVAGFGATVGDALGVRSGAGVGGWRPGDQGRALILVGVAIGAAFFATLARTTAVRSRSDRGEAPLDVRRVRWGMGAALVAAVPTLLLGETGARTAGLLWAVLSAVPLWRLLAGGRLRR